MTYDEYTLKVRARVKKFHAFELWLKKHKIAVITVTVLLFAAVFAVMYFSGSFIKGLKSQRFVYGERGEEKTVAFLSGVSVSFTDNGEETAGFPSLAGEYDVTAKTVNPFGKVRQSDARFVIEKRSATITLSDFTVAYGDEPENVAFTASGLAEGDTAYITGIEYDRFEKQSDAKISGVIIKNGDGEDVTTSYELSLYGAKATVTKRNITVVTGSAEKKWDGEPLQCHEYRLENSSLAYDDEIKVEFNGFISAFELAGRVNDAATVEIYSKGENVTDRYALTLKYGTLLVTPRKIKIETDSAEKEYDGEPLYNEAYTVIYSELMENHELISVNIPSITNTGKIKNQIGFEVADENKNNMTEYYDIEVTPGTLTVNPREIVIKTPSYEFEYDSFKHQPVESIEITSGEPYEGDSIELASSSLYLSAGRYKSMCTLKYGGAVPASAYHVTFDYGTVTITKRPLTVYYKVYGYEKEFLAVQTNTDILAKKDQFASESMEFAVSVNVDYGEFEEIIKRNIKIINTQNNSSAYTDETDSYDITVVVEYDKNELDEFKASVTTKKTEPENTGIAPPDTQGAETGTGTETEPAETRVVTPAEIYGDNGIGSGGVGGGIGNSPSPYSSLPSEAPKQSKEPVGSVTSFMPGAVYLRLRSFGGYTGTGWAEPAIYQGTFNIEPLNLTTETLLSHAYDMKNELTVKYNADDGLAPVPYYTFSGSDGEFKMTDIAVPASDGKNKTFSYSQIPLVSANVIKTLEGAARFEWYYTDFVYEHYLDLPEETKTEILKIIEAAGLDASSPTIISDVADFVKHAAEYSGAFEKIPDGEDRVIYFLTESKQGICSHFASAATVIYRALGIPARYTVGYYVVCEGAFAETEFYTKDAHAWAEVYIDGVGWVPVDATGSTVADNGRSSELQPPDTSKEMFYNTVHYKMKNFTKVYDGVELVSDEAEILAGGNLKDGHRIEAVTAGITNCGTVSAVSKSFHIYDENGNDVTDMYEVKEFPSAELTVTPLVVFMPEITLYVGQTIKVSDCADITDGKVISLLSGEDKVYFDFTSDYALEVTDVGITGIAASTKTFSKDVELGTVDGSDGAVTKASDNGEEILLRQQITIKPFENVRIKSEPYVSLHGASRITGENGKIYNYLVVKSADASKRFDGEYLSSDEYTILNGALAEGHELEYKGGAAVLYAGEKQNMFFTLRVTDGTGADVTKDYVIDFYPGTLTVFAGEYDTKDPVVTVTVNGEYDLNGLIWDERVSNLPVTYDNTGDGGIVRVQNKTVIGIEPGKTYIGSYLSGADLNGDGVPEYLPTQKRLEINVLPAKKTQNTFIYIILIVTITAAVASVTVMMIQSTREKRRIKN